MIPTIKNVVAHEILDSRGWPTVAVCLTLSSNQQVKASVPVGASVGQYEVCELRDGDTKRYGGRGVHKAVAHINTIVGPALKNTKPDFIVADLLLDQLGGAAVLGANTTLAISMVVARAQALVVDKPLWQLIADIAGAQPQMPRCMANIINGGAHATNGLAFQELMIVPPVVIDMAVHIQIIAQVYHSLKKELCAAQLAADVGDEGGFAPLLPGTSLSQVAAGFNLIELAATRVGITMGVDLFLACDVAASELFDAAKQQYNLGHFAKNDHWMTAAELGDIYSDLARRFALISIEDGFDQDDWAGWSNFTKQHKKALQLVGDDLFVTNPARLEYGIAAGAANSILVKPNQIGTVSQTLATIRLARAHGYRVVVSHRSGETNDAFIADLAVGVAAEFIKLGAPCRGERVAKYNRLLAIAHELS